MGVRLSTSVLARPHSFFHVFKRGTKEKESAFSKSRFSFLYYLTRHNNGADDAVACSGVGVVPVGVSSEAFDTGTSHRRATELKPSHDTFVI